MNPMMIAIEAIVLIILFTSGILYMCKDPLDAVYDLPQPIIDRCVELGLLDEEKKPLNKETKLKKLGVLIIFVVLLTLLLHFVNKAYTFRDGFLTSYILWLIVDWYDCFILDWCWFCHSKRMIIPGTEDLIDSYKDYKFHFLGSCKGMLIGLPACLLVGGIVALVSMVLG